MLFRMELIKEVINVRPYIKGLNEWNENMIIEFVDMIQVEFPNWKPTDFILFLDKSKRGEFKSKFEHSVDFPTWFQWAHDYDNQLLEAIERNRKPVVELSTETHTSTTESSEDVLRAFYAQMKHKRELGFIEHQKRMEKYPDQWQDMREAQQAYRQASLDHATETEGENANGFRILAARQEWEQANPENEWVSNWIEMYKHYKIEIS